MDAAAVELPSNPGSLFHVPPAELSQESNLAELITRMDDDDEAKKTVSVDKATHGFQLVEGLQHHCRKDESAPGPLLCVPPAELSEERIVAVLKTIMDEADAKNIISLDKSTHGLQLVDELRRRNSIEDPNEETTSPNIKAVLDVDEVESANTVHQVQELRAQDDETGVSVPPLKLSNNVINLSAMIISEHANAESVTSNGQAISLVQEVLDFPQQDNKSVFVIPSVEVCESLVLAEMKPISNGDEVGKMKPILINDESENTGQETKDAPLVVNLCSREDETKLSMNPTMVAETSLQEGTVSYKRELIVEEEKVAKELHKQMVDCEAQKHENTNLNLDLDKKRTEIAGELESLRAQMGQKLKQIEELAKKEAAIDTEIAHMELQCDENKCKHANFIDFFKLIVESQLPLHSHRGIKVLMDREDKAATKFLTSALKLRTQIEARARLKQTLMEDRIELEKLLEALKLQMGQHLKYADEVNKPHEYVDSETTRIVPQHSGTICVYTRSCRKRKLHDDSHYSEQKELSPSEVQAKRTDLNTVEIDSSQQCVNDGMSTD